MSGAGRLRRQGVCGLASEVQEPRHQTAKATEDSVRGFAEIQSATGESVQAIKSICRHDSGRSANEISTTLRLGGWRRRGRATKEGKFSRNVQQAAPGPTEVSSNIAGVTTQRSEAGRVSGEVSRLRADLAASGDVLRGKSTSLATIGA